MKLFPFFRSYKAGDYWILIISLKLLLGQFGRVCGSPILCRLAALGVRIHQPAKTNDSSWWNIIIARSYTALPHRWNIIIVRVKNEPGATGALMELLPHGLDLSFWGQTHLKMNLVNLYIILFAHWPFSLQPMLCRDYFANSQDLQLVERLSRQPVDQFVSNYVSSAGFV